MRLLDELQHRLDGESSLFRAQLLREDIARLTKLGELARSAGELDAFRKAAMRIGWTQGDSRTQELGAPLTALLDAVYAYHTGAGGATQEACVDAAWEELHRMRMERLVGCLSNPVPKPTD